MSPRKPGQSLARTRKAAEVADIIELDDARARRAYDLRQAGKSWWAIAEILGITEGQAQMSVDRAVAAASQMVSDHAKRQLLVLEVGRLDELMSAHWDRAVRGDHRATDSVLKIIAQRTKLLGLDDMSHAAVTQQTVIVAGTSEEYIAALRSVSAPHTFEGEVLDGTA